MSLVFLPDELNHRLREAVAHVRAAVPFDQHQLSAAIVLGSGLGGLADKIESPIAIDYNDIPGFARSTAGGHRGQLIVGTLAGKSVVAMAGRFHRYEGWTGAQVAFPIQVMQALGAGRLIVSNAAGGINPQFHVGDLMLIRDHINWLHGGGQIPGTGTACSPDNCESVAAAETPWREGTEREDTGGAIYDASLCRIAHRAAIENGFTLQQGTYLATLGPTYETRAEYRMMRRLGADAAGMSTVGEVIAGAALGMRIVGISLISNVASVDRPLKANHEEVLKAGRAAAGKMERLVLQLINE